MVDLSEPMSKSRKLIGYSIFVVVLLGAVGTTWLNLSRLDHRPRTTDASVSAEVAKISAGIPGLVHAVYVEENATVKAGQLLFELDATTYKLEVSQAAANVDAIKAAIREAEATIRAEGANAASAQAEIVRATNNLALAQATADRLRPLVAQGIASRQSLDVAETAAADAAVSLNVARQTAQAAQNLVKTTDVLTANLRTAEAALALSKHMLSRTKIHAPFDGKAVGVSVVAGEWLLPDIPTLSLIDQRSWYTEAFFKETELSSITIGDEARVWVLSEPGRELTGVVKSIGWGVVSSDAIAIDGRLPFVAQTTNWVRLAKRFPVHIEFEGTLPEYLRIGSSATVALGHP
jgi:multidrug efflux system membrane fusion protein